MTLDFEQYLREDYAKRYIEYSHFGKAGDAIIQVACLISVASIIIELISK